MREDRSVIYRALLEEALDVMNNMIARIEEGDPECIAGVWSEMYTVANKINKELYRTDKGRVMIKNIEKLAEWIIAYPNIEVIAMVDHEVVWDDSYSRWIGRIGEVRLDEYYWEDERIYFKSTDEDELKDDYIFDYGEDELSLEELEAIGNKYLASIEWQQAIVVNIDTY